MQSTHDHGRDLAFEAPHDHGQNLAFEKTPQEHDRKLAFDAMYNLAIDCHEKGKIEDALDMFRALSFIDPRDPGVWKAMARCHEDLGQEETAALLLSIDAQIREEVLS
jgi:hypothetical protein